MNILICSHWFAPSIGGVETVTEILAEEWTRAGHRVTVVTDTVAPEGYVERARDYSVRRRPSRAQLRHLGRSSDVIFQNLVSLETLLPLLTIGKPIVVAHQSWLRTTEGKRGWRNWIKMLVSGLVTNCSISKAIADDLLISSTIIPNPFCEEEFHRFHNKAKTKDVVFVGRLVSDKGCDLLLEAVGRLHALRIAPEIVSIIGGGPELTGLRELAKKLAIEDRVRFLGPMRDGRGEVMAQHRVHVVPSRWKEPFGVVALEGIASGCAMLVSAGGGLPDAIGPCGLVFPNDDCTALAAELRRLLNDSSLRDALTAFGPGHLERFRPKRIASDYISVFEQVVSKRRSRA